MRDLLHALFAYCVILRILRILTNLKLCFPLKLFARNKTFAAPNGEFERFDGFALTVYTTRSKKELRVESSFSTAF